MREPHSDKPGQGDKGAVQAGEDAALNERLKALKADLGEVVAGKEAEESKGRSASSTGGAMGVGLRAGSELGAGVIVGGGIGYLLDQQFGASPLFLIIFLMIGMAAGFWNVYRLGAVASPGQKAKNSTVDQQNPPNKG